MVYVEAAPSAVPIAPRHASSRYRHAAISQELTARQRLTALRREVNAERVAYAMLSLDEQKQAAAEQLRAEKDRMFNRDLRDALADEPRATEEEVIWLSERLNAALCREPVAIDRRRAQNGSWAHQSETPSWYRVFKQIDADGSGQITFAEFEHFCRKDLGISTQEVAEDGLTRVWLSLDADCSGLVTTGEFGAFMRMGQGCEEAQSRRVHQRTPRDRKAELLAKQRDAALHARHELEAENLRLAQRQLLSPDHAIMQTVRQCDQRAEALLRELEKLHALPRPDPGSARPRTAAEQPLRGREALRASMPPAWSVRPPARKELPKFETPRRTYLMKARAGQTYY